MICRITPQVFGAFAVARRVPITIISTGPDREQTIIRQNPFG